MKKFIKIIRGEEKHKTPIDKVIIKQCKKTNTTKFKLRTPKYLLTLKVDQEKAQKINQSIPQSKCRVY